MKRLILLTLIASATFAFADGGVVQFQKEVGNCRITLFSPSAPLRAGPADLSVLLQDSKSAVPILDAEVILHLKCEEKSENAATEWHPPCCSMDGGADEITVSATHEEASNKLLYASQVVLPYSGMWNITISVKRNGKALSTAEMIRVEKPTDPWMAYLPYLLLPGAGIGIFAMAQKAKQARRQKRKV